jgi:hypothetical protein
MALENRVPEFGESTESTLIVRLGG